MVTVIWNDSVGCGQPFVVNGAAVVILRVNDFDSAVNGLNDRQASVTCDDISDPALVIWTSVAANVIDEMDLVLAMKVTACLAVV